MVAISFRYLGSNSANIEIPFSSSVNQIVRLLLKPETQKRGKCLYLSYVLLQGNYTKVKGVATPKARKISINMVKENAPKAQEKIHFYHTPIYFS